MQTVLSILAANSYGITTAREIFTIEYRAYCDLQSIGKDKDLSVDTKIQLSSLRYAAETCTTKKDDKCRLLAFEMQCYRRIQY